MFAYYSPIRGTGSNVQTYLVSFTDSKGIEHTAKVAAWSLFEPAALAIAEFERCGPSEQALKTELRQLLGK